MPANTKDNITIVGIVNITEDSFSDGGKFIETDAAIAHAHKLIEDGADVIDLGAESTRPGSNGTTSQLQWKRLKPVIEAIKASHPNTPISIDTQDSRVAHKAIELGADIINDISSLRNDPDMAALIATNPQTKLILMHIQGTPKTMQLNPFYTDVIKEVKAFLRERIEQAMLAGIAKERLIIDPGIGFGKNLEHNLSLLAHIDSFKELGVPIMLAASRKRFIDYLSPSKPHQRVAGSLAATSIAYHAGLNYIRVHDVFEHKQFLRVLSAIQGGK